MRALTIIRSPRQILTVLATGLVVIAFTATLAAAFPSYAEAETTEPTAATVKEPNPGSCGFGDVACGIINGTVSFIGKILASVLKIIVEIFAALLGLVGMFFNIAMFYTVFNFGQYFGNSEGLLLAWRILRDLANIALLFGFVFIGIATIIGSNTYNVNRTLPALIIAAVLLNFSLFIAEAMVDVSNAVASSFYAQAGDVDCRQIGNEDECANKGLVSSIITVIGIGNILSTESWDGIWGAEDGMLAAFMYFLVLLLVIVLIGVLFAGALMLVSRAITLMIVFITSPIGIAGAAIPPLQKFSQDWWKRLTDNLLFAPVFVLLALIGLKIMEGLKTSFVGANGNLLDLLTADAGSAGDTISIGSILILFALVVGFFWAALISAKKFSVFGANAVVGGAQKWIGNTAGGFTVHPVGWAARGIGKGYEAGLRAARSRITSPTARFAIGLAGGNAIDAGIRSTLGGAQKLKIPGTKMDSFEEMDKRRQARKEELNKGGVTDKKVARLKAALQAGVDDDIKAAAGSMSVAELKEHGFLSNEEHSRKIATVVGAAKFKEITDDMTVDPAHKNRMETARYSSLEEKINNYLDTNNDDEIEKFMRTTDIADLKKMKHFKDDAHRDRLQRMMVAMPHAKFKQFNDDQNVDSAMKKYAREARYEGPEGLTSKVGIAADPASSRAAVEAAVEDIERWTPEEFETSGILSNPALRAQAVRVMSDKQYDAIQSSGNIGTATKRAVESLRNDPTEPDSRFGSTANIAHTLGKIITKSSDRARLPGQVLTARGVLDKLDLGDFIEVQKVNRLEPNERQSVANYVNNPANSALKWALETHLRTLGGNAYNNFRTFYGL